MFAKSEFYQMLMIGVVFWLCGGIATAAVVIW